MRGLEHIIERLLHSSSRRTSSHSAEQAYHRQLKLSVFLVFKARVCGDFPVLAHRSPVSLITTGKAKPIWCHTHQHCLCCQDGETDVKLTESITEVTTSGYFFSRSTSISCWSLHDDYLQSVRLENEVRR